MAKERKFKLSAEQIVNMGVSRMGCIATDKITVDGLQVGFMLRDEPNENYPDSGWQFYSGTETQEWIDDPENSCIYALNTIANCDPAIIPYLDMPVGARLERVEGSDEFVEVYE